MCKLRIVVAIIGVGLCSVAEAASSAGVKFAADEADSWMQPDDVAGVVRQAHWTNARGASGGPTQLYASDGSLTPITVTWISGNVGSSANAPSNNSFSAGPDRKLMSGYLDNTFLGTAINFSGLPADPAGYDVYVYTLGAQNGAPNAYHNMPGFGTYADSIPLNPVGYSPRGDYFLVPAVHPDAGHLAIDCFAGIQVSAFDYYSPINAVQLVALSVPIPEPAAASALAMIALTVRRPRRHQESRMRGDSPGFNA